MFFEYIDLVSLVVLGVVAAYGFRTALILIRNPEMGKIRNLWLPVSLSTLLLFAMAIDHLIEDEFGFVSPLGNGIRDLVVLVASLLLGYSMISFYRTWSEYARQRKENAPKTPS
ncbi:MAG TPA: hypothetical protein VGR53_06810 [Nitrososphaerales archaeon]|nr:hypothetical protein [Nitrososphaerales archaeon]